MGGRRKRQKPHQKKCLKFSRLWRTKPTQIASCTARPSTTIFFTLKSTPKAQRERKGRLVRTDCRTPAPPPSRLPPPPLTTGAPTVPPDTAPRGGGQTPDSPTVGFRHGSNAPSVNLSRRLWGKGRIAQPAVKRASAPAPPGPARPGPHLDFPTALSPTRSSFRVRPAASMPRAAGARGRPRPKSAAEAAGSGGREQRRARHSPDRTARRPAPGPAARRRRGQLSRLRPSGGGRCRAGRGGSAGPRRLRRGACGWLGPGHVRLPDLGGGAERPSG